MKSPLSPIVTCAAGTACLAVLPIPASADVLVVDIAGGPGAQYSNLQLAVDAASVGDTVLVRSGDYDAVTVSLGLTLSAEAGALVRVFGSSSVANLPAGQAVTIRGLDFEADAPPAPTLGDHVALRVVNSPGAVWIEDAKLRGDPVDEAMGRAHALEVVNSGDVFVERSTLRGGTGLPIFGSFPPAGGDALRVAGGALALHDSVLIGGIGPNGSAQSGPDGSQALELEQGFVFTSGCTFRGGTGGVGIPVFGCGGGDGGDAVHLTTDQAVFWERGSTFLPGNGGPGTCGNGSPGGTVLVLAGLHQPMPGLARSFQVTSPVREFDPVKFSFEAEPFEPVFLGIGSEPFGFFAPALGGTILPGGAIQIVPMGILDAAGTLDLVLPLPPLPPGTAAQEYVLQAAYVNASGAVLLGGGSVLVALDQSL